MIWRKEIPPEQQAYLRLRKKGFSPASIIDVGAYHGDWTKLVRRVFDAPVLMVEAQRSKHEKLREMCGRSISLAPDVLGATSGKTVTFYEMETGSSLFEEQSNVPRQQTKYVTETLDNVAAGMPGPIFLKIDVQGAELEVLRGGEQTLSRSEIVQLEIAMLSYNKDAPSFLEVISYMDRSGFVPYDISGFSRPDRINLVQIDLLFCRKNSALRPSYFTF